MSAIDIENSDGILPVVKKTTVLIEKKGYTLNDVKALRKNLNLNIKFMIKFCIFIQSKCRNTLTTYFKTKNPKYA